MTIIKKHFLNAANKLERALANAQAFVVAAIEIRAKYYLEGIQGFD